MKIAVIIVRVLMGLLFLFASVVYFLELAPAPELEGDMNMSKYIDGFVIPVPKGKLEAYRKMAEASGKIWMEYGALQFMECVGDDLDIKGVLPFSTLAKTGPDETVIFSWIVYASKEQRDEINAKIMEDPRMKDMCENGEMPFECDRMSYGGFRSIVAF